MREKVATSLYKIAQGAISIEMCTHRRRKPCNSVMIMGPSAVNNKRPKACVVADSITIFPQQQVSSLHAGKQANYGIKHLRKLIEEDANISQAPAAHCDLQLLAMSNYMTSLPHLPARPET